MKTILPILFFAVSVSFIGKSLYEANVDTYRYQGENWLFAILFFTIGAILMFIH
jgi:hypothetical protein